MRFGERLLDAVKRIALRELAINVTSTKLVGYIEYPSHYEHGLDSPVGIAFEVLNFQGEIQTNQEASNAGWFKELPKDMHEEQIEFLRSNYTFMNR